MKKIIFLLIFSTAIYTSSNAQSTSNTVYFELGGPGLASFNYDTRFTKNSNSGFGGRIGIGGYGDRYESVFTVPLGINYITSGDNKNFFEVGMNYTFVKADEPFFDFGDINSPSFATLNFGYRKQPIKNGFVFRAAVNPVIAGGGFNPFYFGIAFGYKF